MVALAAAGVTATCSQAGGPRYGGLDADSNLPDVRIAVGGPDVNAFTAEVLSAAGPGYARWPRGGAGVGARGAQPRGGLRAQRRRARGVRPAGADRDGQRAGGLAAAVTALAEDLADALVEGLGDTGDAAPSAAEAPLADRSVALLNRGTPSGVVTPDGTLHMSLMRSCSGWPSRIWIDGDHRTAPDEQQFRLAALEPHVRVRAGRGRGRLAHGGLAGQRRGLQPRPDRGGGRFR